MEIAIPIAAPMKMAFHLNSVGKNEPMTTAAYNGVSDERFPRRDANRLFCTLGNAPERLDRDTTF